MLSIFGISVVLRYLLIYLASPQAQGHLNSTFRRIRITYVAYLVKFLYEESGYSDVTLDIRNEGCNPRYSKRGPDLRRPY